MKLILCYIILIFSSELDFAQNKGAEKLQLFDLIDQLHENSEYDSASKIIELNLKAIKNDSEKYNGLMFYKLYNLNQRGHYDSMEIILSDVKDKMTSQKEFAYYKFYKSIILSNNGDFKEGISLILEAIDTFQEIDDLVLLASSYNYLGVFFKKMNEFEPSLDYFKKALKIGVLIKNEIRQTYYLNNIGSLFSTHQQLDSALFYYDQASFLLKRKNNYFLLAQNTLNRGNILEKKGDYKGAFKLFNECLEISEREGLQYGVLLSKLNIGNLYRITKNYALAEPFLLEALLMSRNQNLKKEELLVLQRLTWLKKDQNLFKEAYDYMDLFHTLTESLVNDKNRKESKELIAKYEAEKKNSEIFKLNVDKKKSQLFLSLLTISALVLIVILLWINLDRKKALFQKVLIENEKEKLQRVIEQKDKELNAYAAQVLKFQDLLAKGKEKVFNILKTELPEINVERKLEIRGKLMSERIGQDLIKDFDKRITSTNVDFFKILLSYYPDLRPSELKLCAYLRINLTTKEISEMMNKSVRTLETQRLQIRKKIGLAPTDNLVAHLISLEMNK